MVVISLLLQLEKLLPVDLQLLQYVLQCRGVASNSAGKGAIVMGAIKLANIYNKDYAKSQIGVICLNTR